MSTIVRREEIPVAGDYDILVAGGGLAGAAAALAAARHGKRVLLVEKQCCLGGLATSGLVNYWVPLCNGRGKMIVRGIAEEWLYLSFRYGFSTLPKEWQNGEPSEPTLARCAGSFSAGLFALSLLETLRDAGVTIQYDTAILDVVMDGGLCRGAILHSGGETSFCRACMLVDATGDAQLLRHAGMPTIDGTNYHTYYSEGVTLDGCRKAVEKGNVRWAYTHLFGGPADLHGRNHPADMPLYRGASPATVNAYLQRNQLELLEKEKGKEPLSRNIHMLPGMPQLRTSRRLDGDATFTADSCYRHCPDSIGAICDFEYRDFLYEVPYGALIRTGWDNLITCGRCASASGWGWDVLRVIPPAILTGQAAGVAAALAIDAGVPLAEVSINVLQSALAADGVMIHFDDALVPEDGAQSGHPEQGAHI